MRYGTGSWDNESLGNHRAVVRVAKPAGAILAHIEWRRRDLAPEDKSIVVICAATDERVRNVARVAVNREFGDLAFEARSAGDYYVYYMPYRNIADGAFMQKHFSHFAYERPEATADAAWLAAHGLADPAAAAGALPRLPRAEADEIQAINDFHSFDPMEVIATAGEVAALLALHADRPYLVFPEDRRHPIRMRDDLPKRWIDNGLRDALSGEACRGECYAFQLGVFAARTALEDLRVQFTDGRSETGSVIPADNWNCINTGGTDWLGRPLRRRVSIAEGKVQPLWCWVQVPAEAEPGEYSATATVSAAGAPQADVHIALTVTDELRPDAGDDEPWRHSRLRWLDSTTALDDEVFAPYTPVAVDGRAVRVLGREIQFADTGLPAAIRTTFPPTVDRVDAPPTDILASPIRLSVAASGSQLQWRAGEGTLAAQSSGCATLRTAADANGWSLRNMTARPPVRPR